MLLKLALLIENKQKYLLWNSVILNKILLTQEKLNKASLVFLYKTVSLNL